MRRGSTRLTHDRRLLVLALGAGLPAVVTATAFLWTGDYTPKVRWTLSFLIGGIWLGLSFAVRRRAAWPLQTLSNLLAALREGDFSIRARGASPADPLGELILEVNILAETLREQRLGALEATALLRKVMLEIDVAVFTFDAEQKLRLVNRAAERLLGQPPERLLGRGASDLGLAAYCEGETPRIVDIAFPGSAGRFEIRRGTFRAEGLPHQLLVLTNLSRALREEERQAWQRLIRVMGHELNNSLAPIKSIAGSLESLLARNPRPADYEEDLKRGLAVIGSRAEALSRFMEAYARLARLPQPNTKPLDIGALVRRVAGLETRLTVAIPAETGLTIRADSDQIEQLLINLVRNAADAAMETGGAVRAGWTRDGAHVEVWVEDDGPGLPATTNLFVPFFTTKPTGSGIGLVLSRQIAEAHNGTVTVANRANAAGCRAVLRLPV